MKEKYSIIRSADRYIELRQYKKAIKVYQSLIDSGEKDPSVVNNLGDLQLRNGEREAALKNFSKAANIYSDSGDALKALGICRKLLRMEPSNDETLNLILDLNQRREAVFDSKGILTDLVNSAVAEKDFSRAADLQQKLVGLGDKDPVSSVLLAELSYKAGQEDKSIEAVHRSLDLFSSRTGDSDGWAWLKELLESRNSSEDFISFVEGLQAGYVPSPAGKEYLDTDTGSADEPPPLPPDDKEDLISPEFFEVDGSIGLEEDLEGESSGPSQNFADSLDLESGKESESEVLNLPDEFPGVEEVSDKESSTLHDVEEAASEEDQEFEFNLDEGELSRSPEEFLEMLEADIQAEEEQAAEPETEDEPTIEELKEEYASAAEEAAEEDDQFELNLDQEDLDSGLDALGIEDLDKPVFEDSEADTAIEDDSPGLEEEMEVSETEPQAEEESVAEPVEEIEEQFSQDEDAADEAEFELNLDEEEISLDEEVPDQEYPDDLSEDVAEPEIPLDVEGLSPEEASDQGLVSQPEEQMDTSVPEGGKIADNYDEVESALEGLFVLDSKDADQLAAALPEDIQEQEYPAEEGDKLSQGEELAGNDPVSDPDDDPDVQVELGIAYRDMALMEDAIGKFENALLMYEEQEDRDKCVLCCQLLAECCNGMDRYRETLKWVARGLDYRKVSEEEIVSFEYESAVALEELGDYSESLRGFRRIQSIHPGFRDVESRISDMESAGH